MEQRSRRTPTARSYINDDMSSVDLSGASARNRRWMLGLVEADLSASGKRDRGQTAPALLFHGTALHFLRFQRFHRRLEVVAHEVQFVQVILLGRMKRSFRRRQGKNQPAVACVYCGKFENIAKKARSLSASLLYRMT